ncbi:MAG: hypothetical protein ACM3ZB_01615 [bacterium]|jgi:hypothetical protein
MLLLKPGVRIAGLRPETVLAVVTAERILEEMGVDCVITAALDGKHTAGSLHYSGAAVDIRSRELAPDDLKKLVARLRECLGEDFDVVLEIDHVHLEFQPKKPYGNA